jgi:hypothetical protein
VASFFCRESGQKRKRRASLRAACMEVAFIAFSSEVDAGSREENASKQEVRGSVLIQSEPKL